MLQAIVIVRCNVLSAFVVAGGVHPDQAAWCIVCIAEVCGILRVSLSVSLGRDKMWLFCQVFLTAVTIVFACCAFRHLLTVDS